MLKETQESGSGSLSASNVSVYIFGRYFLGCQTGLKEFSIWVFCKLVWQVKVSISNE